MYSIEINGYALTDCADPTGGYENGYVVHTVYVTKECRSTEVPGISKTLTFYIPETSADEAFEYVFTDASEYVSAPTTNPAADSWNTCY